MTALIIRGGTAVNHDHSRRADALVRGETIVAIGSRQPTASTPLPAPPMTISTARILLISAQRKSCPKPWRGAKLFIRPPKRYGSLSTRLQPGVQRLRGINFHLIHPRLILARWEVIETGRQCAELIGAVVLEPLKTSQCFMYIRTNRELIVDIPLARKPSDCV